MIDLENKIKALKRPDNITAKYIIEAELDDIINLIESEIKQARFDELTKLGRLYNGSKKIWCDHYESRYKLLSK